MEHPCGLASMEPKARKKLADRIRLWWNLFRNEPCPGYLFLSDMVEYKQWEEQVTALERWYALDNPTPVALTPSPESHERAL
jgi:hypothetical protein